MNTSDFLLALKASASKMNYEKSIILTMNYYSFTLFDARFIYSKSAVASTLRRKYNQIICLQNMVLGISETTSIQLFTQVIHISGE